MENIGVRFPLLTLPITSCTYRVGKRSQCKVLALMSAVGRSGEMSWLDKTPSDSLASRHNRWKTGNEGEGEVKGDESR